jgi:hypothetical protein
MGQFSVCSGRDFSYNTKAQDPGILQSAKHSKPVFYVGNGKKEF